MKNKISKYLLGENQILPDVVVQLCPPPEAQQPPEHLFWLIQNNILTEVKDFKI